MGKQPVSDDYATAPPSAEAIKTASNQAVFGEKEGQVSFGELIKPDKEGGRVVVIFIRHFHCGLCQEYVEHLSKLVRPAELEAKGVKLFIVGCGASSLIKGYRRLTNCPFPLYSDPNRNVQTSLGMTHRTLDRGSDKTAPSHSKQGVIGGIFTSIARAVQMGNPLSQSGDIQALGGDFVFGDNGQVIFSHRMTNTRDHTEVHDLLKHAGVDIPPPASKTSKTTATKTSSSTPAAQPAAAPVAPPQAAVTPAPQPIVAPAPTPAVAPQASAPAQPTAAPPAQTAPESYAIVQPSSAAPTSTATPTPTATSEPTLTMTTEPPKESATAAPPQTSEPKLEPVVALPKTSDEVAAAPAPAQA